jgi:hypothetical protein
MADLLASLQSAAGAAGGENLYIEDVFSTTFIRVIALRRRLPTG